MSTRRAFLLPLLAGLALGACGEQQTPESVAGPSLAGKPTDPAVCDPNSLNSLITGYFPGNSGAAAKNAKDQMLAATAGSAARVSAGFTVLQEIGNLSRAQDVDTVAGSTLAQGIIKCMYNAKSFAPTFPTDPIYNFAPALSANRGGAFYVRGAGSATTPVQAAVDIHTTPNILSGVNPLDSTWAGALQGSPAGMALIYGYRISGYPVNNDPFVYEWATIPPATQFAGGAVVALCDDVDPSTAMVHESNIGVLAYQGVGAICAAEYSVTIKDTGWGPRALAARLARVVVDAIQPQPLQATSLGNAGTGGTASTFKSRFQKKTVDAVTLTFAPDPPATLNQSKMPYPVRVFVSSGVDDPSAGVNGVCVYLTGATNNGTNTAITGNTECENTPAGGVSAITRSVQINGQPKAGYADFSLSVTKTGQLIITASSTDGTGKTGVVGRDGQTFVNDVARTNVKP
jgi:hypothetical protein